MRLLNFSIGQIHTIQVGGETVRTGHLKAPVAEPWLITEDGAEGDRRAVHPDKLYAFAREGYDHWGAYFGVDPARWPDGFFGENLTLDRLDEEELRVGDVFALGEEVRLVVAGARNPCLKLAWRLGQPRTFQRVFALSRRSGVYLGVVQPGRVRPGDGFRRIAHDPDMPSIADVCDYIAGRDPPPLAPLRRLLAFDRLSPTNRLLLGAKLEAAEQAAVERDGGWRGWRPFVVDRVADEAPGICSLYLRPADGKAILRARPGQHVAVRVPSGDGALLRHWSLSSHGGDPGLYRLTIRRQRGGGSAWAHRAKAGDKVELRMPAGNFVLDEGSFRPVVLVGAGIGITPLKAMLDAHLVRRAGAPVHLIYGARDPAAVAFRDELDALAAAGRLDLHYVFSRADAGPVRRGRIDTDLVVRLLQDLHIVLQDHRVALPWHEADIYICGPGDFCAALRDGLVGRGGNADHIALESFAAAEAGATEIMRAEIRFARSGVGATWTAERDLSLLELAEEAGVAIASDCRAGSCLTCRTRLIEGEATVSAGEGTTLMCIARPRSARLVVDR